MKRCPACGRTYADAKLSFCLEDGQLLTAADDSQEAAPRPEKNKTTTQPPARPAAKKAKQDSAAMPRERAAERAAGSYFEAGEISGLTWTIASGAILLVSAFLRLYDLTLKPLHHDEGVNGFFLQRLVKEGVYHYDPSNYHGPTLYYFTLVSTSLNSFFFGHAGLSTVAVRLVPALFGVATIWLVLCLRRHIGSIGALIAAALLAVSPGAVYMSRYFIHEALFTFFTLGIVVACVKYYDAQPPDEQRERLGLVVAASSVLLVAAALGAVYKPQHYRAEIIGLIIALAVLLTALWLYDGERSTYLLLASVSAALLFATKETAMISAGVLLIAVVSATIYMQLRRPVVVETTKRKKQKWQRKRSAARTGAGGGGKLRETIERFGGPTHIAVLLLAALAVFVVVGVVFYSSFFTNAKGVADAFETFKIWAKTGTKDHTHPWYRYVRWLAAEESGVLILGAAGIALAVWRAPSRFVVVMALWAFGITAAYSLIPYKTPWLMLNFIVPLAIMGGYAVEAIRRWGEDMIERLLLVGFTAMALGVGAVQAVSLNFLHYDDDKFVYVYAHTVREFLPLVDDINRLAKRAGTGTQTGITVTSPDYWPLPWYLRDYNRVGYFGRTTSPNEPLIICSEQQLDEMRDVYHLEERYRRVNSYPLRPGVQLLLYARRDLTEPQGNPPIRN